MPEDPPAAGAAGAVVASSLVTPIGRLPVRGAELGQPLVLREAGLAWDEDGEITYVGPADGLPSANPQVFEGCTIVPGFVDGHTHLPFFGWRADEFEARLAGATYGDLHGEGGIYRSARLLAEAGDEAVLSFSRSLAQEMADYGTTSLELKTGYGLSVEGEVRQARLARRLAEEAPQTCTVTLLACHAVPKGTSRADWVRAVCDELIPAAAAQRLADTVDVYVEDIAFTVDDLRAVAEATVAAGLPLRCHADQLGPSGAAEAAVALGARSADHLNYTSAEGIDALGAGDTVAFLLPASTFLLRGTPPPVRAMIAAGAPIALASDLNPGTSPVLSMPDVTAFGCSLYGLSPHEALTAATLNPAWVLGLADVSGTLEPGKRADFLVLDVEAFRQVPYRPGHNPVVHTYIAGRRVGGR
ncbi:MAG: imidazolonepropionase [Actinomycetota bacterium]